MTEPAAPRILVVEDDPAIAGSVVRGLRREGFTVELATDGAAGRAAAAGGDFDLVVLDLMLPEVDGYGVLEALRTRAPTPVLVVTARTGLDDRLKAFQLGAADYLPKPFWMEELVARVRARLRAPPPAAPARVVQLGALRVNLDTREAAVEGVLAELTTHEFNLLAFLAEHAGRPVTRGQLVAAALSVDGATEERTVDSHVARIRKKLGAEGARVETVRHLGYRLRVDDPAR